MKTCLFTVTFAGSWGQQRLSLEASLDEAAGLGFDGVEIMGKRPHLSPLDVSEDDCRRLADGLAERGLSCAAVAAYTNFTGGMGAAEVPFVEMQVAYVGALARRAAALGGDLVRIFTAYERDDAPVIDQWRRTVDAVRQCADRAGECGVTIGVQNHHDLGVDTKMLAELIHEVDRPNVIPMLDLWSVYLRGEDVAAAARAMAPRMRFTTAADYVVLPRSRARPGVSNYQAVEPPLVLAAAMGEGELPYATFFDALVEAGFDGWASYEMCWPTRDGGDLETLRGYCRRYLEFMKPWR